MYQIRRNMFWFQEARSRRSRLPHVIKLILHEFFIRMVSSAVLNLTKNTPAIDQTAQVVEDCKKKTQARDHMSRASERMSSTSLLLSAMFRKKIPPVGCNFYQGLPSPASYDHLIDVDNAHGSSRLLASTIFFVCMPVWIFDHNKTRISCHKLGMSKIGRAHV